MENKEYVIYTKKLAFRLSEKGCKLIRTGINENFPQFDTYIFEDNQEFQTAMSEIMKKY